MEALVAAEALEFLDSFQGDVLIDWGPPPHVSGKPPATKLVRIVLEAATGPSAVFWLWRESGGDSSFVLVPPWHWAPSAAAVKWDTAISCSARTGLGPQLMEALKTLLQRNGQ